VIRCSEDGIAVIEPTNGRGVVLGSLKVMPAPGESSPGLLGEAGGSRPATKAPIAARKTTEHKRRGQPPTKPAVDEPPRRPFQTIQPDRGETVPHTDLATNIDRQLTRGPRPSAYVTARPQPMRSAQCKKETVELNAWSQ